MTQQQKDALETRSYLHDRALMRYGDKMEASGKCLLELLGLSSADLSAQYGMKRGHIARFTNRTSACAADPLPTSYILPAQRRNTTFSPRNESIYKHEHSSINSRNLQSMTRSSGNSNAVDEFTIEKSMASFKIKDGYMFKGIVAAVPEKPSACGCVQPPPIVENVALYSTVANVSVQKLTPEYKIGLERLIRTKTPPMKASELWREKTSYTHLHPKVRVKDFWPRYWGGVVLFDRCQAFVKALGGGKLLKDKFISGFLLAIANYKRAKAMGVDPNFKGECEIKVGLFIVGKGKNGIAYQFIERNFGNWAPLVEVIEICTRIQNQQQSQSEAIQSLR